LTQLHNNQHDEVDKALTFVE